MKILYVVNGFPTKSSPEYCVFTKDQISKVLNLFEIESELVFINAREEGLFSYIRAIPDVLRSARSADIVHAFHGLSFIFVFFLCPRKKILVSFLNSIDNEYQERPVLSRILVRITKILIRSGRVHKIFKSAIPSYANNNSYYLPNGVDTDLFSPVSKEFAKRELGLDSRKRYVLFVSSKDLQRPQKRLDRYLRVVGLLARKLPEVEQLCVSNITRDRLILYYCASDLHLLTSDFEGSPNSVKEALSCNLPVISTDVGNVREMISGVAGCHVADSSDDVLLANLCEDILVNLDAANLDIRSYLFDRKLDINSKTDELHSIYERITGT